MDHLVSVKVHLCFEKIIGLAFDQVKILVPFYESRLDLGTFLFKSLCKTTMQLLWNYQYYATLSHDYGLNLHPTPWRINCQTILF
jgi:hypothetical protein